MKIIIDDQQTIAGIREAFNGMFPFLKLEFFSRKHQPEQASPLKFLIRSGATISECRRVHSSGELTITPQMTVNELEQLFDTDYGLSVQVFRKSGRIWLETVLTDTWTLAEQNAEGESLNKGIEPDEPEYYQDRD